MTTVEGEERYVDLDGVQVHYVIEDGPADGPLFLLIHGLGGSWVNWAGVMPQLAALGQVVAPDLGGHGLTQATPERSTVRANLHLLQRFVRRFADGRPVIAIGNSMGGMLAAELAALEPGIVAGAVLIDPAIPPTPRGRPHPLVLLGFGLQALPFVGPRLLAGQSRRVSLEQQVEMTMRLVTTNLDRVSPQLREMHLADSRARRDRIQEPDRQQLAATKSVLWQLARRRRLARAADRILGPVLLLHGAHDRLVHVRTARALAAGHPHWTYVEGAEQGHTPMLDYPDWVGDQVLRWLAASPGLTRSKSREPAV